MKNNASSRTGLFLMELIIAVLFFSLAGAICVQLFVQAHIISNKSVELNHGILWAQNTAEAFYGCNGNTAKMTELFDNSSCQEIGDSTIFCLYFDGDFNPVIQPLSYSSIHYYYVLTADIRQENDLLTCHISVAGIDETEEPVYEIDISLFPDKEDAHEQ